MPSLSGFRRSGWESVIGVSQWLGQHPANISVIQGHLTAHQNLPYVHHPIVSAMGPAIPLHILPDNHPYTREVMRAAVRMSAMVVPSAWRFWRMSLKTGFSPSGSLIVMIAVNGTPPSGITSPARVR